MKLKDIVTYVSFIIVIGIVITMSFYFPNFFNHYPKDDIKKSTTISDYLNSNKDIIVEQKEFDNILEVVTKDNKYKVVWFDEYTGDYLTIDALINNIDIFHNKVKELLMKKYPKFISDVLINDSSSVYYFKDNELIVYYYNYVIEPMPSEELYLTINYNEIKDLLKISVSYDSEYSNEIGFVLDPNKKHIALTFDDGPGKYTSTLVGYLNDGFAHATFFMQGSRLNSYKEAVLDVYNSGNEIGYHSYQHKYFKEQTINTIKSELTKSNNNLKAITGTTFELVRPPYGSITDEVKKALDMPIVLWNVDTEDWKNKDSEYLTNYVLENINDGDIVLFHDIHETSVEAIPALLKELYVRGYQAVSFSELAQIKNETLIKQGSYRFIR